MIAEDSLQTIRQDDIDRGKKKHFAVGTEWTVHGSMLVSKSKTNMVFQYQ